ncbi:MAG TPA: multifunctional CCA addition/repair protein, partial [Xanthomonadales bacterium]|nr:multifunctional CCA addition/repair protein [Xanthomonadales bacterium]
MQTYLVGGAVRDALLGRAGADRDHVVVGATPAEMLALGFRPVGKDFPVFLHPQTHEEYALARIERKTGPGYHGFAFHAAPDVTLEDDLRRRDLTINAMAQDADGTIVDPFGGRADLDARLLRHVSDAFVEDPVRVLRVARFAARYASLGFTVAPETHALMRRMVDDGELAHLVPERVWQELSGALREPTPSAFLRTLVACGALAVVLPEVAALYGVPQRADYHPEVDTGVHQELVSDMAARLAPGDALVGWCALVHDLGKGVTPAEVLPKHVGHEHAGVPLAQRLAMRLKVPVEFAQLGAATCKLHLLAHQALELKPSTVLELFEKLDALRKPGRVDTFLVACEADKRGRGGRAEAPYPQGDYLRACFEAARAVSPRA